MNVRAEAISGCQELLRAAAGPILWFAHDFEVLTANSHPGRPHRHLAHCLVTHARINPSLCLCSRAWAHRSRSAPIWGRSGPVSESGQKEEHSRQICAAKSPLLRPSSPEEVNRDWPAEYRGQHPPNPPHRLSQSPQRDGERPFSGEEFEPFFNGSSKGAHA